MNNVLGNIRLNEKDLAKTFCLRLKETINRIKFMKHLK